MRVLFVAHAFPRAPGDIAGAFILRLAVALRARGVEVDVLAPSAPGLPESASIEGVPVTRFRYAPASWETLAYTGTMAEQVKASVRGKLALVAFIMGVRRAVQRAAATGGYDVVHAHWWFPAGMGTALAGAARPFVVTMHGSDVRLATTSAFAPRMFRFVADRASAMTTVSHWLANTARTFVPDADIAVAPMPADIALFHPGQAAREASVLFVGRLNAQKGVRALITAAQSAPGLQLDIVGDGPDRSALERFAFESGVQQRIRWHGTLSQAQVAPMYRAAAAVAMPSRDEGLGLVAVEALLSGTPVVAYRSGGVAELIESGVTGLLVEPGDARELGAALTRITSDPERARAMGAHGRARMLDRFAPAAAAAAYATIYQRVIA